MESNFNEGKDGEVVQHINDSPCTTNVDTVTSGDAQRKSQRKRKTNFSPQLMQKALQDSCKEHEEGHDSRNNS